MGKKTIKTKQVIALIKRNKMSKMKTRSKRVFFVGVLLFFSMQTICQNIEVTLRDVEFIPKDSILKIEFFYLPWGYMGHNLTEENVRNYGGRTTRHEITDLDIIAKFEESLSVFNMCPTENDYGISVIIVIDFYFKSETIKTILVNRNGRLKYEDYYYRINFYLAKLLIDYLPPANMEIKE